MKILIIDDDQAVLFLVSEILDLEGYEIFTTPDPYEGVTIFEKKLPDLVLLDVHMPGMSGIEMAPILKKIASENGKFVPIIFFTSSKDVHELVECIDSGGDDLISKPFNENLLEAKLRAWQRNINRININEGTNLKRLSSFSKSTLSEEEILDLLLPRN
jgi:two-component system, HptB-dependent secretion and biofilm response regulator